MYTDFSFIFSPSAPVQGTRLVSYPDPPVIYEGTGFTFHCLVKKGTHLAYMWYHNKREVTSHSPLYRLSGNTMTVDRASERHAGYYVCMATNSIGNTSRSSSSIEVPVVVKSKHLFVYLRLRVLILLKGIPIIPYFDINCIEIWHYFYNSKPFKAN